MQKRRIILIIGIVLAMVAVIMVNIYVAQQREIIKEQAKRELVQIQSNQGAVLVAKEDIPKGTVIDGNLLETAIVPNQYVQPQAATSLDRISGMITIIPISKGEQIILSKLSNQQTQGGGSLAMATPVGKRAITITVDNVSSLVGMIKPGDYVDVIGMLPIPVQTPDGNATQQVAVVPLFQNVLILAVGQETGMPQGAPGGRYAREEKGGEIPSLITIALSPQEANLIAFVQEQGKIRLILRSPADSQIQSVQPASWETLFKYMMPQEVREAGKAEAIEEPSQTGYVEIYRGLNKEKIPLSK